MTSPPPPIRVLVVDDEPPWRYFLRLLLNSERFELHEAADGKQAQEFLQRLPVDVLITDTNMPNLNGIALTRFTRLTYPQTKIILLCSGKGDPNHAQAQAVAQCGADLILTKDEVEGPLAGYLMRLMSRPGSP